MSSEKSDFLVARAGVFQRSPIYAVFAKVEALLLRIGSVRGEGVARRYQELDDDGQPENHR